jgi:hypothetical protein
MADHMDESERLDDVVASQLPVAVKADELDHHDFAKLALEVARNIQELPTILTRWGLTPAQYDVIQKNPFYTRVLQTYIIEWNAAGNVEQRLKLEAGAILEDASPAIAARMNMPSEDLGKVVEAAKMFAKMAGIGEEKAAGNPGEKFTITINLGEDAKLKFEKDVTPAIPLVEKEKPNEPA